MRAWLATLEAGAADKRFDEVRRLARIVNLFRAQGRPAEAAAILGRWLAVAERSGDRLGQPEVRKAFDMLASLHRDGGRTDEAWALVDRWLAISGRGAPTAKELAALLQHILALCRETPSHVQAEALVLRWLTLAEVPGAPAHPGLASALRTRGEVRQAQGRHEEAEADYRRARLLQEAELGPNHPEVLATIERHAALLEATGRASEAETLRAGVRSIRGE